MQRVQRMAAPKMAVSVVLLMFIRSSSEARFSVGSRLARLTVPLPHACVCGFDLVCSSQGPVDLNGRTWHAANL